MAQSRRLRDDRKKVPESPQALNDALALLATFSKAKFDESVVLDVNLNIDPRKQDQNLRGAVSLPNGTGKTARVICFAEGEAAQAAKDAGAVEVGSEELVKKIAEGWTDFDVAVSTPDQMRHVGRLGKVLGPQGKMPAPKAGTVTSDVATAVREFTAGKIEFRTDSGGNIHVIIGKRSFSVEKLAENAEFMFKHLKGIKPSSIKGNYFLSAALSSTMSPGVPVAVSN